MTSPHYQGIYYIFYTWLFQAAFYTVEVESHVFHLIPVVLSALFLNVVTPSGGASGAALFVDDAAQRGQSAARTAAGTVLALIADYFTFTLVLIAGLVFLFINHDLQTYEIVGSVILLFIFLGLVTILFLGLWNPNLLQSLLKFIQTWVSRLFGLFKRQSPLDDDWYITTTEEFAAAGTAIRSHPSRLGRTLLIAMAAQFIDIASLYFIFGRSTGVLALDASWWRDLLWVFLFLIVFNHPPGDRCCRRCYGINLHIVGRPLGNCHCCHPFFSRAHLLDPGPDRFFHASADKNIQNFSPGTSGLESAAGFLFHRHHGFDQCHLRHYTFASQPRPIPSAIFTSRSPPWQSSGSCGCRFCTANALGWFTQRQTQRLGTIDRWIIISIASHL